MSRKRSADIFGAVEAQLTETAKRRKKVADASDPDTQTEHAALSSISEWLHSLLHTSETDWRSVEVELRLGRKNAENFMPGIQQDDFDTICAAAGDQFNIETSETYSYHYNALPNTEDNPTPHRGNIRITFDEVEKRCLTKELKTKIGNSSVRMGHLMYDLRSSVANEFQLEPPVTLPDGWTCRRHKLRYSFNENVDPSIPPLWRVDLTRVITHTSQESLDTPGNCTHELEVEFLSPFENNVHLQSRETIRESLNRAWTMIQHLLNIVQNEQLATFNDLKLEMVRNEQELENLRKVTVEWVPNFDNDAFPGPMPIAFSRRYLPIIQAEKYMVSEKSDGLRYMMLINSDGVYFVSRQFDFYFVTGLDILCDLYATNEITLLDGELVRHQTTKRPVFMIFDAVVINGSPVASKTLVERLEAVRDKVILPFRQAEQEQRFDPNTIPFTLIGKVFLDKSRIGQLFDRHIRRHGKERFYQDNRRHHKTDGIILTPVNSGYRPTQLSILKWKYADLVSIDFKMKYNERLERWMLCASAGPNDIECLEVDFLPEDNERVSLDMRRVQSKLNDGSYVLELTYDQWSGRWRYMQMRPDKVYGNGIKTVLDTMQTISENVTQHELAYRVAVPPERDHWQRKFEAAMRSAMPGQQPAANRRQPPQQQHHRQVHQQQQQQQQQQQRAVPAYAPPQ